MPAFSHEGRRLEYSVLGRGTRTLVLLHALLMSRRMHEPLARALADRGNRVVTLDLLGHGESERPRDMTLYSIPLFGEQVVGLLDHLGADDAVIGGTSLGANVALEVAALAPRRVRGLIAEMPVLDNALLGGVLTFTPLLLALTFGARPARLVGSVARRLPTRRGPWLLDTALELARHDPGPGSAILQGIFFGRIAPHRTVRRTLAMPALAIGHRRDPVHPFSDADGMVSELPRCRLLEARSILELRVKPERLTEEIASFLDACWAPAGCSDVRHLTSGAGAPAPG